MSRIQTKVVRAGKKHVGEINPAIGMPSTNRTGRTQDTMIMGRSPSGQILGNTSRGVVTFDGLKKNQVQAYQKEINLLESKKKEVSSSVASVYAEGQEVLRKIKQKTQQAKNLDKFYFFEDNRPIVKQYVREKAELIGNYENRVKQLQDRMKSSERYIDRIRDDRRGASGEQRIRLNTQRREERAYLEGLRRELNIINQFKNKNIKEVDFWTNRGYYAFKDISQHAHQVGDSYFRNQSARIWNRHQNQVANHRAEQERKAQEQSKPQVTPHLFTREGQSYIRLAQIKGRI